MNKNPLGQATHYPKHYDPALLFAIPRQQKRDELGLSADSLPFIGFDVWHAYEVSWLNEKGKPEVRIARIVFDCQSSHIVESKSLKLYLNAYNQSVFVSEQDVQQHIVDDLARCTQGPVTVELTGVHQSLVTRPLPGTLLDEMDIVCEQFSVDPALLRLEGQPEHVKETVHSHLLKSNCLVTQQPDWASVVIAYEGSKIQRASLLKYIVSFREHSEFHEQCVERIFTDIMGHCRPEQLCVYALYTRRGGIDINPVRTSPSWRLPVSVERCVRQ